MPLGARYGWAFDLAREFPRAVRGRGRAARGRVRVPAQAHLVSRARGLRRVQRTAGAAVCRSADRCRRGSARFAAHHQGPVRERAVRESLREAAARDRARGIARHRATRRVHARVGRAGGRAARRLSVLPRGTGRARGVSRSSPASRSTRAKRYRSAARTRVAGERPDTRWSAHGDRRALGVADDSAGAPRCATASSSLSRRASRA